MIAEGATAAVGAHAPSRADRASAGTSSRLSRTARMVLAGLAVLVTAWCAAGIPTRATYGAQLTADEPQYVLSAISLAEDHNLDISDELAAKRWKPFHSPANLPVQTKVLSWGRQISPHDPLLPLLLAVPVALGGWVGAKLALAAMAGGLAALLVWIAHRRFGVPFAFAVAGVAVFALAPPLAVYGTQVYPEIPAALVVAAAIAIVTGERRRWSTAAMVLAITALPWLSVKYVAVAAVLAVAAARRWRSPRALLAWRFVAVLAASGAIYVIVHRLLYGGWTVYAAGDHFAAGEATVMGDTPNLLGRSRRLVGLLVDRDFGLIPWQPAFLLALPAVVAATLRRHRHAWHTVAPLAAGWLTATFAAITMQGWWWPGRQIVVVLPAVVLLTLWWAAQHRTRQVALLALGAVGILAYGWLAVQGAHHSLTWVVDFMTTSNPLYRVWRPLLPDGRSTAARDLILQAVWSVVAITAIAGMGLAERRRTRLDVGETI
jgi:hypothetical protein